MSEVYVGKTLDGFPISIKRETRCGHVQIVGSTGRGKTKSVIVPWMIQDFIRGASVVVIDGKGHRELADEFERFSDDPQNLIVFDIGDPASSAVTNPIRLGSPQQITDRIFSSFEFDNSYYETVAYEAVLLVLELFTYKQKEPTFRDLYKSLTDDAVLSELATAKSMKATETPDCVKLTLSYLAQNFRDRQEKLSGFLSQLRPFAVGELSGLVNGNVEGRASFSLSEQIAYGRAYRPSHTGRAIVILISALLYQKAAKRLGQMFLQEIAWATAAKRTQEFIPVYLDEFSSFVYEGFLQLLNKARSSNVALHLSHQSMGDLEMISLDFAKAVVTNTNVKCVLGINDPETAEFFAMLFGTKSTTKTTERADRKTFGDVELSGALSVRDVEQYRIHPNRLKAFANGKGALSFMLNGQLIVEEMQFATVPGGCR